MNADVYIELLEDGFLRSAENYGKEGRPALARWYKAYEEGRIDVDSPRLVQMVEEELR